MQVRFWGTRGSIATPGRETNIYGGNTSCVQVTADDGTLLILDCGSGARALGMDLLSRPDRPCRLHLLLGHTHWDHIQGFPFFAPAFAPESDLHIYAPAGFQRSLEDAMAGQMQHAYFPVKLDELRSHLEFTTLEEGSFRIGDVLVETQYLNHTAPTIGYRISSGGATVAYITDHEPYWRSPDGSLRHPGDQRHAAFLQGVDLVIHDAQYSEAEYRAKVGWGHSSVDYAVDVAMAAGVRQLALFHHDPTHDDRLVARLAVCARARVTARGGGVHVIAAAEGTALRLQGSHPQPEIAAASAVASARPARQRILVVSGDVQEAGALQRALTEDQLVVRTLQATQPDTAFMTVGAFAPDLIILDGLRPTAAAAWARSARSAAGRERLPVLLLTDRPETVAGRGRGKQAITDYVAKPFSIPMLRARVRSWLQRTRPELPAWMLDGEVPGDTTPRAPEPDLSRDAPVPIEADWLAHR